VKYLFFLLIGLFSFSVRPAEDAMVLATSEAHIVNKDTVSYSIKVLGNNWQNDLAKNSVQAVCSSVGKNFARIQISFLNNNFLVPDSKQHKVELCWEDQQLKMIRKEIAPFKDNDSCVMVLAQPRKNMNSPTVEVGIYLKKNTIQKILKEKSGWQKAKGWVSTGIYSCGLFFIMANLLALYLLLND